MFTEVLNSCVGSLCPSNIDSTCYIFTILPKCFQRYLYILPGEPVDLSGDGRYDSPGHSARYCTYTLMDSVSVDIRHGLFILLRKSWFSSVQYSTYSVI